MCGVGAPNGKGRVLESWGGEPARVMMEKLDIIKVDRTEPGEKQRNHSISQLKGDEDLAMRTVEKFGIMREGITQASQIVI